MNEETTPNVTAGVDKAETGKMKPERRKELADSMVEASKRAARAILSKVDKPETK